MSDPISFSYKEKIISIKSVRVKFGSMRVNFRFAISSESSGMISVHSIQAIQVGSLLLGLQRALTTKGENVKLII